MASAEVLIGNPLAEQGHRWPAVVRVSPKSYLGKPKEWGRDFPPATTVSPRARIGSLPHRKEPVK